MVLSLVLVSASQSAPALAAIGFFFFFCRPLSRRGGDSLLCVCGSGYECENCDMFAQSSCQPHEGMLCEKGSYIG
jgi:hypothetical protein